MLSEHSNAVAGGRHAQPWRGERRKPRLRASAHDVKNITVS